MKANTWIAKKLFHSYLLGHCCPLCQKVFYQNRPGEKSGPPLLDVACEHCGILFREQLGKVEDFKEIKISEGETVDAFVGRLTH